MKKSRDRQGYMYGTKHMEKKQLLESGKNSAV